MANQIVKSASKGIQRQHVRRYLSGKTALVNIGKVPQRKGFYGGKDVHERYFIGNENPNKQPIWVTKDPADKELGYYPLVEFRQYPSSPYGDADHDGIKNIFDRKPLDAAVRKEVPPTVKEGNHKLADVIGVWSLPRYHTCPGKTPLCSKYCYAESPEKMRPSVVYSRNKNVAWSQREDFVSVMSRMLKSMNLPWFRIHESGDFYSQEYFNKWVEIAKANPQTKFLAYTKNYKLDFSKRPANFTIRYSSDISSENIRADLCACFIGINSPPGFFTCKKRCKPGFCMACWDEGTDVYIPIHSISNKDRDQMFFKQYNPDVPSELKARAHRSRHLRPDDPLVTIYGVQV